MRYGTLFIIYTFLLLSACHTPKQTKPAAAPVTVEEAAEEVSSEGKEYQPSAKRVHDLLHTKLELSFNYEKKEVNGIATLSFRPYFYPSEVLELDAKNFELKEIKLLRADGKRDSLAYSYNNKKITIQLDRKYRNNETYTLRIVYTAFPDRNGAKGSAAITDSKGLYFINADGKEKDKPRQIWTQGETEYASCWFPTIDSPNEKMTQEIYLTVNEKDVTLSNGELMYSNFNKDGTRTDCWKQDLPHSPYLTMLAVGPFTVTKEVWRDSVEVSYYLEQPYQPYARLIFGNTREMLEFYSKKLGVNYPWKKFAQVVVRDFVSGAMENTGAVVHGEFLQHDAREHIDDPHEDVIAHELFHHWFGDLVTAESWANLPLNESFATYGEYLWIEHKYGKDEADFHQLLDYQQYMGESMREKKRMIRFYHKDPNDMFDNHSYQKGGLILNMLRNYVGDEAFFKALQLYLTRHKFSTAEMHQLRLCFEEVTGEDLNWFFNQWFYGKGHPDLETFYAWLPETKEVKLTVLQKPGSEDTNFFRMPVDVDFCVKGKVTRGRVWLEGERAVYRFKLDTVPDYVLADPERVLLCSRNDVRTMQEWWNVYRLHTSALIRLQAFQQLHPEWTNDSLQRISLEAAIKDPSWHLRLDALDVLGQTKAATIQKYRSQLTEMAVGDPYAGVRATAFYTLKKIIHPDMKTLLLAGTNDSAYSAASAALYVLAELSPDTATLIARLNKPVRSPYMRPVVAEILSKHSKENEQLFFEEVYAKNDINSFFYYSFYLLRQQGDALEQGVRFLEKVAQGDSKGLMPMVLSGNIYQLQERMEKEIQQHKADLQKLKEGDAQYLIVKEKLRVAEEYSNRLLKIKVG